MRKDIIKPIETEYNGYLFRSKLEAQWAVVFDSLGIRYEYEPEGFELEDGTKYLPDFYFPDQDTYGEVKPDRPGALEELLKKSLKSVANGAIKKLVILPNIPAATKKDPVWWVPLIKHDPFAVMNDQNPFSSLKISKALISDKIINTDHIIGRHEEVEIQHKYYPDMYVFKYSQLNENTWIGKAIINQFSEILLRAIPSRDTWYYTFYDNKGNRVNTYDDKCKFARDGILGYEEVENIEKIMSAFRKARQARFDHGQTPEVSKAG